MVEWLESYGLVILFAIVAIQAAGVPGPPGKTALVTAAILAARGHFAIASVVAVATAGILVGGYTGFIVTRVGGRPLLARSWIPQRANELFGRAEIFFEQHGGKAVFLARFLPGLKVVAAPAAGLFGMSWSRFSLWHAASAVTFALVFGLGAYFLGEGAIELVEAFGIYGAAAIALVLAISWLAWRMRGRVRRDLVAEPTGHIRPAPTVPASRSTNPAGSRRGRRSGAGRRRGSRVRRRRPRRRG